MASVAKEVYTQCYVTDIQWDLVNLDALVPLKNGSNIEASGLSGHRFHSKQYYFQ